jgi:hypothetical protein
MKISLWQRKIRIRKINRKKRKARKKELGFVGAGLKPTLWELAHRKICARRAKLYG